MTTTLTAEQIHQITASESEAKALSVSGNIPGIQAHFAREAYIREVMGPRAASGSKAEVNAKFVQAWRQAHADAAVELAVEYVLDSLERWEAQYDRSPRHDIWQDCILGLPGYDEEATERVCGADAGTFVADGQIYEHDYAAHRWLHRGPYDRAKLVNDDVEQVLADLNNDKPYFYVEGQVDQAATAALDPGKTGDVLVLVQRMDHAVLRRGENGWERTDEVYPAK